MAATLEMDEGNGAGQTITHSISNMNYGSTDAANIVAGDFPITPNTNSYKGAFTKYFRAHVTNMGGVSKVKTLKFWRDQGSLTSGDLHKGNVTISGYANKTYATPTTALMTFYNMDTSEPASANLGINSLLTGEITSVSVNSISDYIFTQVQVSSSTTIGAVFTCRIQWDEVAAVAMSIGAGLWVAASAMLSVSGGMGSLLC